MSLWGGIEAGGTKFICVVGTGSNDLRSEVRFPTMRPDETIAQAVEFFEQQQRQSGSLKVIGIGSFGPIDPNPDYATYGYITDTPKPQWEHTDFVGPIRHRLGIPVAFDTDVNAAAMGEHRWGAAQGWIRSFILLLALVLAVVG